MDEEFSRFTQEVNELVRKVAEAPHDNDAFNELMKKVGGKIAVLVRHMYYGPDWQDILQEVVLSVWQSANRLKQFNQCFAWICKIAKNKVFEFLRKAGRLSNEVLVDYDDESVIEMYGRFLIQNGSSIDKRVVVQEILEVLDKVERRIALLLSYYLTVDEIARILQQTPRQIRYRIQKIRIIAEKYL